ncbi:MAG: AsnC family protein, partial [Rhodobacteraceae bacterium]|nr:AsnC family protein [Paracoccaceae bacterium]
MERENGKDVRVDALDRKIMAELQRDADRSLEDIARAVGSSKTPVWNRIKKLRGAG